MFLHVPIILVSFVVLVSLSWCLGTNGDRVSWSRQAWSLELWRVHWKDEQASGDDVAQNSKENAVVVD